MLISVTGLSVFHAISSSVSFVIKCVLTPATGVRSKTPGRIPRHAMGEMGTDEGVCLGNT